MTSVRSHSSSRTYHPLAYKFVFSSLRFTQEQLGRDRATEATGHISGQELLDGIRRLGLQHFGMLSSRLEEMGSYYGAHPGHEKLWEAATATADDLLARLAIVHMVHGA